jgi:hypothetical protein
MSTENPAILIETVIFHDESFLVHLQCVVDLSTTIEVVCPRCGEKTTSLTTETCLQGIVRVDSGNEISTRSKLADDIHTMANNQILCRCNLCPECQQIFEQANSTTPEKGGLK